MEQQVLFNPHMEKENKQRGYSEIERKYRGSINGFMRRLYKNQRGNSKRRGHPPPSYSFGWLLNRALSDECFIELYGAYLESGMDRLLSPSFDRVDDSKPYTKDNIQLMTFGRNQQKAFIDQRCGKIINGTNPQKAVVQLTKGGVFVAEYVSLQEANRQTGIFQQNIGKVCMCKRKYAGGFIWMYKEDYNGEYGKV